MAGGLAARSVARTVAATRGFYRYLALGRHIAANPADDLQPPRTFAALPNYLSIEDVDRLLAAPDTATPRGVRDRAFIELLYATGLRVSELVGLKVTDVNLEAGFLTTKGKGGKERLVPVGDEAVAWLMRYLRDGRPALLDTRSSPRLFVNARGGTAMTRMGLWKTLKGYGKTIGICAAAEPARPAALVRDAPARARRRPARDPGDARPRRPVHDTDLHARARSPLARRVRSLPSRP